MENKYFLLADNQDITRAGLRHYIESLYGVEAVCVDVCNKNRLIDELAKHNSAIVILDYTLFDLPMVSDVINLRQRYPLSAWAIFSTELTQQAIRSFGAEDGISLLLKENAEDEIRSALRYMLKGDRYICHQISNTLIKDRLEPHNDVRLTPSEIEVLKLIARGKSVKEIAAERNSSVHTIITHKKNIFRKIEVNNIYEATKYALHAGLVDLMEYYI